MDFTVSKAATLNQSMTLLNCKNIYNFKWKKMHFYVKIEA